MNIIERVLDDVSDPINNNPRLTVQVITGTAFSGTVDTITDSTLIMLSDYGAVYISTSHIVSVKVET